MSAINASVKPPLFSLVDLMKDPFPGFYYREQLTIAPQPDYKNDFFAIEKVLKTVKRKIHHKGRKRFFPTVSIRSESNRNDFSEKVFVQIKMIHISILSYSLNSKASETIS